MVTVEPGSAASIQALRMASIASPPGTVRVPHMHMSDPSSGFSPRPTSDIRLRHGQGNF
ncbi:hypothetical protein AB7008_46290 [Bradyrhizobium sp. 521_C7_N1_3]|uniref:hypothetical protein n=1 Tax=Bradyrhizobium sp. 521_C7_N1_3 TaxID=3240368 RepID=UPI003F89A15B